MWLSDFWWLMNRLKVKQKTKAITHGRVVWSAPLERSVPAFLRDLLPHFTWLCYSRFKKTDKSSVTSVGWNGSKKLVVRVRAQGRWIKRVSRRIQRQTTHWLSPLSPFLIVFKALLLSLYLSTDNYCLFGFFFCSTGGYINNHLIVCALFSMLGNQLLVSTSR